MKINTREIVAKAISAGLLTAKGEPGFRALAGYIAGDRRMTDPRWGAYVISTVRGECGPEFLPVAERRARPGTPLRATQDRYWSTGYYGRGYVQLTWRKNYERMSREVDADLVADPDRLIRDPAISYRVLSAGMVKGLFTGKGLADYILGSRCDWDGARRIINGRDKAAEFADRANSWFQIIK
jgi:putative chitinase